MFQWLAYTDLLSTLLVYAITVSILQTEKERRVIVVIAWLTFLAWLTFSVLLALPSSAELLGSLAIFLNIFSITLAVALFFARKSPLLLGYRWLALALGAPFLYRLLNTTAHLVPPASVDALIEVGSFLLQNLALFILLQKAPGFRRPAITE